MLAKIKPIGFIKAKVVHLPKFNREQRNDDNHVESIQQWSLETWVAETCVHFQICLLHLNFCVFFKSFYWQSLLLPKPRNLISVR